MSLSLNRAQQEIENVYFPCYSSLLAASLSRRYLVAYSWKSKLHAFSHPPSVMKRPSSREGLRLTNKCLEIPPRED